MNIKVVSGDITQQTVGAIIVNLFEGVTAPGGATGAADISLDGAISRLIEDGEIKGKGGEMSLDRAMDAAAKVVAAAYE